MPRKQKKSRKNTKKTMKKGGMWPFDKKEDSTEAATPTTLTNPLNSLFKKDDNNTGENTESPVAPVESTVAPAASTDPSDKKWYEVWKGGKGKPKKNKTKKQRRSKK